MRQRDYNIATRSVKPQLYNNVALAKARRRSVPAHKSLRGNKRNLKLPFVPPEDWHEPSDDRAGYKVIVQPPGIGFRHVLTPADVRARLAELPAWMLAELEVVQFSRMTRKKQSFPCYGMQWGASIYLYPIEESLIECYSCPPTPAQANEARMFGGCWSESSPGVWTLTWTEQTLRDFYLNNVLIHELGHVVDCRNTGYVARERYAEWFALEYGYKPTRQPRGAKQVMRRHHAPTAHRA